MGPEESEQGVDGIALRSIRIYGSSQSGHADSGSVHKFRRLLQ